MAIFLNNQAGFKLNTTGTTYVDLSDHVASITITRKFDELDITAMGDAGHRFIKGLESSTIAVEFFNDDATASVLQSLQATWGTNAAFKIVQTQVAGTATVSATNPLYTGVVLVNNTTDVAGAVSEVGKQTITFTVSGAITVAITGTF